MLPLTTFKEKVSFNTKVVMLRCFIKEIISTNVIFRMYWMLLMYWMLPLSSRIAPANVRLPLKYFKQNLSPLTIPFYGHIEYTAKYIKITKKSRKASNSSFLPGYNGFDELI